MTPTPIESSRLLLVDRFVAVREAMRERLEREPGLTVCGVANDPREAAAMLDQVRPHVIITEIKPDGGAAVEFIGELRRGCPGLPVLVLSVHDEVLWAERALGAGASGYVMKSQPTDKVIAAIHRVLDGGMWVSDRVNAMLLRKMKRTKTPSFGSPLAALTDREIEVYQMLGQGLAVRHIAAKLSLSVKTVEVHREHLKEKLGLRSAMDLIRYAMTHGPTRAEAVRA